jgi:3,4-dihydroxy 2-butanone 4-phosphate synthase/GTP cyclohydrolase II
MTNAIASAPASSPRSYRVVDKVVGVQLRNLYGTFEAGAYKLEGPDGISEHLLFYRDLAQPVCNLRINSACFTGDLLHCDRCDCNWQLHFAMKYIARTGQGLVVYHLDHEGRGNGVVAKLRSFVGGRLEDDLASRYLRLPDRRSFAAAATILGDLGVRAVHLITNNPEKRAVVEHHGIAVVSTIPVIAPDPALRPYYDFKRMALRHWIAEGDR